MKFHISYSLGASGMSLSRHSLERILAVIDVFDNRGFRRQVPTGQEQESDSNFNNRTKDPQICIGCNFLIPSVPVRFWGHAKKKSAEAVGSISKPHTRSKRASPLLTEPLGNFMLKELRHRAAFPYFCVHLRVE